MAFDLKDYEEVKDRIPRFLERYPDGRIITHLVSTVDDISVVVFKAELFANREEQEAGCPLATGMAFEREGSNPVNRTAHLENGETSAIGRALANMGIQGKERPSREEMEKVQRMESKDVKRPAARTSDNQMDAKRKAFFANIKKLGYEADYAKEVVKEAYELESFNDATVDQLRAAYLKMKEMNS